jgi:hypothetical protein
LGKYLAGLSIPSGMAVTKYQTAAGRCGRASVHAVARFAGSGLLAVQRYVATSVATGWLRLWFATAIGSMVAAAVATHLRLQALAPG